MQSSLDGLDHLIPKPRELYAASGVGGLLSFEVIDADGVSQIIKLRAPLMLPAPSSTSA